VVFFSLDKKDKQKNETKNTIDDGDGERARVLSPLLVM
jgi:hypothetical protein